MATTTPNLGLRKPAGADTVNVTTDIAANMDLIDTAVAARLTEATHDALDHTGLTGIGTTVRTLFIIGNGLGNYTGATTSFADFDAANWTITMPAAVGDKLRMEMLWVWSHNNSTDYLAGAFAVNGTQLGPSLGTMIQQSNSTGSQTTQMVLWRTVISGDLSGGNVPVKMRYKTSGVTATVYNDSTRVCVFAVTNFGSA